MTDRVDIVVTDKVSPEPAKKLRAIASESLKADKAIARLNASIAKIDATAVTRLTTASAALTNAQAREVNATARLLNARARMLGETNKAALSLQRAATEQSRATTATVRATTATARATTAASQASSALAAEEAASTRLAAAKNREAVAQNTAATAASRAAVASRGAASSARQSAAQTQNLIFQVQDVVVGLGSGQRPLTVLLQQGTQIAGVFGPGTGVIGILRGVVQATRAMVAPFLPVIATVGLVAAGFGVLTNEIAGATDEAVGFGDVVRASFQLAAESIGQFLAPAISAIGPYFTAAYNFVIEATKTVVNGILGAFVGTYNAISDLWSASNFGAVFEAGWKTAFNLLLDGVGALTKGVIGLFSGQINNIVGLFRGGYDAVVAVWGLLPSAFERLGALAINKLLDIVESGVRGVIDAVDGVLTFIGSAAELVGRDNPFANLISSEGIINLDAFRREVGEAPAIGSAIATAFTDAFKEDYAQGIKDAISLDEFRQELGPEAASAAAIVENAYIDAFSTDFAGGAFNAIRERSIKLAQERIAAENEGESATGRGNAQLSTRQKLLSDILKPLIDYRENTAALNELLAEGAISLGQYNQALSSLSLVAGLRDLDAGLTGTPFSDQAALDEIRIAEQERLNIVQQALEARVIGEQDAADRVVAINRQASADIQAIETARQSMILTGASNTFASLSEAARSFAGEQSGIYKALFITSKAFAIADSIIKIQQGIANALSQSFPANLAAAGAVAAAAANIVSSIQAVQFKRDGGEISGPGGPRDDQVPIMASNNEFIVNARDAQRNLPLLRAINSGQDIPQARAYRDGGQVQAYRAPAARSDLVRVGNERSLERRNDTTVNVFTRDPDTRIEVTSTQRAAATARAVNRGQRNL